MSLVFFLMLLLKLNLIQEECAKDLYQIYYREKFAYAKEIFWTKEGLSIEYCLRALLKCSKGLSMWISGFVFLGSVPAHVPQILINRESLSHVVFDVELLGDCDRIVLQLAHRFPLVYLSFNVL